MVLAQDLLRVHDSSWNLHDGSWPELGQRNMRQESQYSSEIELSLAELLQARDSQIHTARVREGELLILGPSLDLVELRHVLLVQRQMLCLRKLCKTCMQGSPDIFPRKVVRKMCGGLQKCAEIVRNLHGGCTCTFSQSIALGLSRMCVHEFRSILARKKRVEFLIETKPCGQKMSQP